MSNVTVGSTAELAVINGTTSGVSTAFVGSEIWEWLPSSRAAASVSVIGAFEHGRWVLTDSDYSSQGLGVSVSGTPTVGQVITATSETAAVWSTPSSGAGEPDTIVIGQGGYGSALTLAYGENATPIIQAAVDAAIGHVPGASVYRYQKFAIKKIRLPVGLYRLDTMVVIDDCIGLEIEGSGPGTVICWNGASNSSPFGISACNVKISNMQFAGENPVLGTVIAMQSAIKFYRTVPPTTWIVSDCRVERCWFGIDGLVAQATDWIDITKNTAGGDANNEYHIISDCVFNRHTRSAVHIDASQAHAIVVRDCAMGYGQYGVLASYGSYVFCRGCKGGYSTIYDYAFLAFYIQCSVVECNSEGTAGFVYAGTSPSDSPLSLNIENNRVDGMAVNSSQTAISILSGGTTRITGNGFASSKAVEFGTIQSISGNQITLTVAARSDEYAVDDRIQLTSSFPYPPRDNGKYLTVTAAAAGVLTLDSDVTNISGAAVGDAVYRLGYSFRRCGISAFGAYTRLIVSGNVWGGFGDAGSFGFADLDHDDEFLTEVMPSGNLAEGPIILSSTGSTAKVLDPGFVAGIGTNHFLKPNGTYTVRKFPLVNALQTTGSQTVGFRPPYASNNYQGYYAADGAGERGTAAGFGFATLCTIRAVPPSDQGLSGLRANTYPYEGYELLYVPATGLLFRCVSGAPAVVDSPAYTITQSDVGKCHLFVCQYDVAGYLRLYVANAEVGAGTAITGYTAPHATTHWWMGGRQEWFSAKSFEFHGAMTWQGTPTLSNIQTLFADAKALADVPTSLTGGTIQNRWSIKEQSATLLPTTLNDSVGTAHMSKRLMDYKHIRVQYPVVWGY